MKCHIPGLLMCGWIVLAGIHTCNAQDGPAKDSVSQAAPVETGPAELGPVRGGRELEVWTGGGHSLNGITSNVGVWEAGVRYGWLLTGLHGPGLARGRLEYAVDAVPVFWVFQPARIAYGFGLNPLAMKWNFTTHGRIVPYFELGGGTIYTNISVPAGTSHFNFTSGGALGIHVLREKFNWSAEVRFTHISNASLFQANPGINAVLIRLGVGLFTHAHKN